MRVLALTTQKGGSGKSTLAASLAIAAMQDGETVAALDTDQQASLAGRGQRREANGLDIQRVEPSAFAGTLGKIRKAGAASLVIVDTPGHFGPDAALALREASLCLLPVKPSILDVEAARPTVGQLRLLGRPFAFVLNQCNLQPRLGRSTPRPRS